MVPRQGRQGAVTEPRARLHDKGKQHASGYVRCLRSLDAHALAMRQGTDTTTAPCQPWLSSDQASQERLAYYRSYTDKLLGFISHSDPETLTRLISVIRSGASDAQILDTIDRLSPQSGSQRNGVPRRSQ
ncbi:uncharacterized protein N7482_007748 [Penicillium canariense]|uniref:Uncharacterized protein n=1 Tax=Penicillium canariense TaxID=189055 RepID=A0A9W9LKG0_9EURO|nr:uncharacterized protein N7482_007748 [Penicillium canariense]KAJ5160744.1 hypothetical protein N7482_007748 [Penicillium canariense]